MRVEGVGPDHVQLREPPVPRGPVVPLLGLPDCLQQEL